MSTPKPTWERLARAARPAHVPAHVPAADPASAGWSAAVAAKAMAGATLGQPSPWAVLKAWLMTAKVGGPLLALLLVGGVWLGPRIGGAAPAPHLRPGLWAEATLRQLKAWHPMECEEAGAIGQLLQLRVSELKTATDAAAVLDSAQAQIGQLLTPEERVAFEAEQARLRAKWFPRTRRSEP